MKLPDAHLKEKNGHDFRTDLPRNEEGRLFVQQDRAWISPVLTIVLYFQNPSRRQMRETLLWRPRH